MHAAGDFVASGRVLPRKPEIRPGGSLAAPRHVNIGLRPPGAQPDDREGPGDREGAVSSREGEPVLPARVDGDAKHAALLAGAAFALYWLSSFILEARNATLHFGVDTWYYSALADGDVFERIPSTHFLERIVQFHPLTVAMAAAWMEIVSPIVPWVTPLHLLKAMFAAIGALGVWAATSAFSAVLPRGFAPTFGIAYAVSFSIWYFSSIEESKIVTASLSSLYIALYLRLRQCWTARGAVALTVVLLLACLNEIVAGFLVIIPIVDELTRRGFGWPQLRWILLHALAGPLAFLIIEGLIYPLLPAPTNPEGTSHFGMLMFYLARNVRNAEMLYSFVVNWLFFNVAAPTPTAPHWMPPGFFAPRLANYFTSPVSAALVAAFAAMIVVSLLPRYRAGRTEIPGGLLLALMAYTLVRCVFFFLFNPAEPLLFSPSVTLAHMLVLAIPFAASKFHSKRLLLGGFTVLLLLTNGVFVVGWP